MHSCGYAKQHHATAVALAAEYLRLADQCGICHRREAESTIEFGGRLVSVCGTCRERGEEAAS